MVYNYSHGTTIIDAYVCRLFVNLVVEGAKFKFHGHLIICKITKNDPLKILPLWCTCKSLSCYIILLNAALTVANIRRVVQGLEWRWLGEVLRIPASILDELSKEHTTDDQREAAVIRYWLLHDPLASWRRLIDQLHWQYHDDHANRISHFAEELTGMYTDSISGPLADSGAVGLLRIAFSFYRSSQWRL